MGHTLPDLLLLGWRVQSGSDGLLPKGYAFRNPRKEEHLHDLRISVERGQRLIPFCRMIGFQCGSQIEADRHIGGTSPLLAGLSCNDSGFYLRS